MELFRRLSQRGETKIAAAASHTFVVAATGALYACGSNNYGQLGLGDKRNRWQLTRVPLVEAVRTVVAGYAHTLVITVSGALYACGNDNMGQLGLGSLDTEALTLTRVPLDDVVSAAVGMEHTVIVAKDGDVYVCGANYDGQLGLDDEVPRKELMLLPNFKAKGVAACDYITVFLTVDGEVYTCGMDSQSDEGFLSPTLIPTLGVVSAIEVCFWGILLRVNDEVVYHGSKPMALPEGSQSIHISDKEAFVLTKQGKLWRRSFPRERDFSQVPFHHTVSEVAAGRTHAIVLTTLGDMYSCSSNRRGMGDLDSGEGELGRAGSPAELALVSLP